MLQIVYRIVKKRLY